MLNHVRSWLYVGDESRPFVVLDGLPGLYGLKYESVTAPRLPLYLCSNKLDSSIIGHHLQHLVLIQIGIQGRPATRGKGNSRVMRIRIDMKTQKISEQSRSQNTS